MKRHRWHRFIFWVLSYFAGPVVKLLTGFRCRRSKGPDAPALIIANHNTNLDPALVGMCFSRQMYFVISEHALRKGLSSKLLRFVFDPIPINKMQTDASAIKEMLRRLKAGYSVCLFAEGNRSYTGVTGPVPPATAK
ncbi:MAG: 1-acyl-sn-glycerol-3-phosphate acyltransferase, partial [Firmicutes bacterium]|nr:1-acyl-sn-glycerol-3-phosphate acyltransferase [Bacillota bacterium]